MAPGLVKNVFVTTFSMGKPTEAPTLTRPDDSNVRGYEIDRTAFDDYELYEYSDILPSFTGLHWDPVEKLFIMTKVSKIVQKFILSLKMVPTWSTTFQALYRIVDMLFVSPPKLSVQIRFRMQMRGGGNECSLWLA